MRIALVSDIHANLQAWNAVLEDIQALGIDQIINLGDVVGYGPNPSEVLESVRKHSRISVIGNHDAVCALRMCPSVFNDQARAAIEWTQSQLDEEACQFLNELPDMARPEDNSFLITHAEVVAPLNFGYILTAEDAEKNFAACKDSIIFIGHTHRPGLFLLNETGEVTLHEPGEFNCDPNLRYIINPGSVGDPRTEDIVASYCIFDSETRDVEFRRVKFDIDAYRQAIDASGLEARPFFIRYLDAVEGNGESVIPTVGESDYIPQFDISVRMPIVKEKKKMHPLLPVGLITLLIGFAAIAWIMIPRSDKAAEVTAAPAVEEKVAAAAPPSPPEPPAPPKIATKLPVTARYVRISDPKGPFLSLAEVEVMSEGKNVAVKKKARQSSTHSAHMQASKAVDGNRRGHKSNLITHTNAHRPIWWEVDLGQEYPISAITLWNRNEGKELMKRLDGFTLEMFDSKRQPVYRTEKNRGAVYRIDVK
ncbi:hypothetical protein NT6N_16670 [Oceaniferula spumae]|uniref:Calcineurin-like phosphoesterase domain-containing protein n=1 Tax=Oceaniferula spumae TaxID=2979115 RepID=A0AAT9FKZ6_9BACT